MNATVRTRFAPSPTGSLHVGNARLAVLNWLVARNHGGSFLLRIEDTDVERNVHGSEDAILRDLRWLGLDWDEGPEYQGTPAPGGYGPYRQSERMQVYRDAAQELTDRGLTYPCYCTDEEVAARRAQLEEGAREAPDPCAALTDAQRAAHETAGRRPALRFRVSVDAPVTVTDVVRGTVEFAPETLSDFVLLRSDGRPTYNFGVVVDDIAMRITHVIRGAGHLPNTPRQVLLFQAFDAPLPVFAHVPTVLGPDRHKLSKRTGAQALEEYRAQGFHPDGLVNYLSLLSWSSPSGEEVLTREELIAQVTLERIGASDVVFDPVKLRWLSGKHIARMGTVELVRAVRPFLPDQLPFDESLLPEAIEAVRTHLETFADARAQIETLLPASEPVTVLAEEIPVLSAARELLDDAADWTPDTLKAIVREIGRAANVKGPALYTPLRRALTGAEHGPALVAILRVQGRERALAQLDRARGEAA
ncbi:MAG TPA: glutamate--tRNA ligase [Longimicrobiales bacterium]|nr:glutamate--tRNA ligase [Longimicrobiales bacterium]